MREQWDRHRFIFISEANSNKKKDIVKSIIQRNITKNEYILICNSCEIKRLWRISFLKKMYLYHKCFIFNIHPKDSKTRT